MKLAFICRDWLEIAFARSHSVKYLYLLQEVIIVGKVQVVLLKTLKRLDQIFESVFQIWVLFLEKLELSVQKCFVHAGEKQQPGIRLDSQ